MDLKSMLNDSSVQRQPPRLHTPQSSFDRAAEQIPGYEQHVEKHNRPQSYHAPYSSDSRSPPSAGYFAVHSPHQHNSASTPHAGTPSLYAQQNVGPYGQPYPSRESAPSLIQQHGNHAPSPSQHPPTPGSSQYHHNSPRPTPYSHPSAPALVQRQSTREDLSAANGYIQTQHRQISPSAQFHVPPTTPLGPPSTYPRPSPHAQRPTSQGYERHRKSSFGSVGSAHSRDQNLHQPGHIDSKRVVSAQRTYSGDEERQREREQSFESVSPKTIPKPPPQRQTSSSYQELHVDIQNHPDPRAPKVISPSIHVTPDRNAENQSMILTPQSTTPSVEIRATSNHPPVRASPPAMQPNSTTPQSSHSSLPPQPSPPTTKQPSLKRNASVISGSSTSPMPPRKRLRRDEIPIFAQSARRNRPLRLDKKGPMQRPARSNVTIKKEMEERRVTNGHHLANAMPASIAQPPANAPQDEPGWEPSIINQTPYEDLTRAVCDWIVNTIGGLTPPSGGAMFEIEAKIGAIMEVDDGIRLRLPVITETIFNKDMWKRTKFESTMNMDQHKQLNTFLNDQVQRSFAEAQTSNREVIRPSHPKESDEFYNLTAEGRKHLPQSIAHYLNTRHAPRVRRTIDTNTGQLKAQIIKSRIADLEVYNPRADFDYRISISIESPWNGESHYLTEVSDGGRDRKKDRMSYRHLAYQIDLTQVSYTDSKALEHELEVEISTEQIRLELDNLRAQRPSRYEDLVRGFLDNVRILCRKGTMS